MNIQVNMNPREIETIKIALTELKKTTTNLKNKAFGVYREPFEELEHYIEHLLAGYKQMSEDYPYTPKKRG